jgi:putative hydrolase of the HAD superfamily
MRQDRCVSSAAVLLDLDGTLLDGSGLPAALRATGERLAAIAPALDPDRFVAAHTAAWQELWPEVEDEWMLGLGAGPRIERRAWALALARCGIDDPDLIGAAERFHRETARAAHRPYADVPAALRALRDAGLRTAIVTNGAAELQRAKLADAALTDAVDLVVVSSEVAAKKPDPAIVDHAVLELGADPRRSWFAGDNLWVDIPAGRSAGLRTAWVNRRARIRPDGAPVPDLEVADLAALVDRLLGQAPRDVE